MGAVGAQAARLTGFFLQGWPERSPARQRGLGEAGRGRRVQVGGPAQSWEGRLDYRRLQAKV